jgi:hypothetical protein
MSAPRGAGAAIRKSVWVRRSNQSPTLYWWNLPLSLRDLPVVLGDSLAGARAVVHPAAALGALGQGLGARELSGGAALVADVRGLLEERDAGRIAPCSIALFPSTARDEDLATPDFHARLERLPFAIAMLPDGDGRARHQFCFRDPGKVIAALEHLSLGRSFGGNAGQVEMALLQGLALRPNHVARLQLVMGQGSASLVAIQSGGRRRVHYLESGKGYTGVCEDLSLRDALSERLGESWRRFPVGVVMFVGLPFFIAAFWLRNLATSRGVHGAAAEQPRR